MAHRHAKLVSLLLLLSTSQCVALVFGNPLIPIIRSDIQISDDLRDALCTAERDAELLCADAALPMTYSIFRGSSALRGLTPPDLNIVRPETFAPVRDRDAAKRAAAILLLLRGRGDAAHEVLLGVDLDNVDDAEYAATHPGQTEWAKEHPLTDSADLIHAALHRLEGAALGEGNHTGFENAKHWLGGGPKGLVSPAPHPVRVALAERAREKAPGCVQMGAIAPESGAEHRIIAGGGRTRTVRVPGGEWDGFAFVNICKLRASGHLNESEREEVADLERTELIRLLQSELCDAGLGRDSS